MNYVHANGVWLVSDKVWPLRWEMGCGKESQYERSESEGEMTDDMND